MKLEDAKKIAEDYIKSVELQYQKMEIVGSIRREKPEVHDIDIIAIPNFPQDKKLIRIKSFNGIQIDIYLANEKNYECLKLIRTGSAEHNRMLCTKALAVGYHLKANGDGLIMPHGNVMTEKGILITLLGHYIEPKDRDV